MKYTTKNLTKRDVNEPPFSLFTIKLLQYLWSLYEKLENLINLQNF